eukprot:1179774-Prorocentrum_minimum.AAC.2
MDRPPRPVDAHPQRLRHLVDVHDSRVPLLQVPVENCLAQVIVDDARHRAPHGPRAVLLVEPLRHQAHRRLVQHQGADLRHLLAVELLEHHHLVEAVEQLRLEVRPQLLHDQPAHARVRRFLRIVARELEAERAAPLGDHRAAHVGGHDHHRVLERNHAALRVRQPPVLHHLQQDVEDVRVRLLDLVQEHHTEGLAAHRLRERAARAEAHVAGGGADELGHRVALHVLGHVQAHDALLAAKVLLGQRLGELRLAHAGGPREEHGGDGAGGVLEPDARAAERARHRCHRVVLSDDALVQNLLQALTGGNTEQH